MDRRIMEGTDLVKQAEKSLRTHFLKWKPDYDVAADRFQQAAVCFKNAKSLDRSKDCFLKAAECFQQKLALFHAAKCLDQVALLSKDLNQYEDLSDLALRASYLFLQCGAPEAAVNSLEKAGKILESVKPEEALKCYQRAAEILKNEDNTRQATSYMNKASRIMIRLKMYDEAADAIRNEMRMHEEENNVAPMGRVLVGLILVHLMREDCVAAEKAYKQWGNYCEPPERLNLENLLRGYDEGDTDLIKQCLDHSFIRHMDVEFARLARSMPVFKEQAEAMKMEVERLRTAMQTYEKEFTEFNNEMGSTLIPDKEDKGREDDTCTCRKRNGKGKQEEVEDDDDEGLC